MALPEKDDRIVGSRPENFIRSPMPLPEKRQSYRRIPPRETGDIRMNSFGRGCEALSSFSKPKTELSLCPRLNQNESDSEPNSTSNSNMNLNQNLNKSLFKPSKLTLKRKNNKHLMSENVNILIFFNISNCYENSQNFKIHHILILDTRLN